MGYYRAKQKIKTLNLKSLIIIITVGITNKYIKLRNTFAFTICLFFLVFSFHTIIHINKTHAGEKIVTVIQSQQISAYDESIKGFEEGCKEKGISINAIYNLKGDIEEGEKVFKNIIKNQPKPDLVLAVGILAATFAKHQYTDIPIIFCMVINHERFNLQGDNITGISSEASIEDQFIVLNEVLGENKNIGVIYDPTKTGKIISDALLVSKNYKFSIIEAKVASENEIASALKNIIKQIDALWIVPDGTVVTKDSMDVIIKSTQKHRIPVFCTSSAITKAGALISVSPDYKYTGIQASQLAKALLDSSKTTSLGVKEPEKLEITINTETAKIINVDLSPIRSHSNVVLYP